MEGPERKFNMPPGPEQTDWSGQTIEQIKQKLFDPRFISKTHDPEGRRITAQEIRRLRTKLQSLRKNISGRENIVAQIEQQASALRALRAEKLLLLEQRMENILVRLKGILKIGDKTASELEAAVSSMTAELEKLSVQAEEAKTELAMFKVMLEGTPDPQKLLETYYEKMETLPLTNAEKRELLKPELLAELSMDEYIALWRRLNPHFLSHVTRQGFRDHNAMAYHFVGLQEFHNGFVLVLEDGKMLRPPMAYYTGYARETKRV